MAALAEVPRATGLVLSPDDGAVLAARAVMRFHLRAFTQVEDDARAGEVEPVHQLRVATRRLRATLRLFAPLLPATFVEGMHRELAWVARAIGPVRDLDVLLEAVKARATRLDPALRKELGPVGIAVHDQRDVALAGLSEALGSSRCRRLLGRLHAFAESQARARRHQRLGAAAPGLLQPLVRAVRGAGRRLGPDSLPADFHRLRVRVKRLRYALETMRSLGGKPVRRLLGELEELQDILGGSQDAVTQITWLSAYAGARGTPPSSLLPAGALIQALARRGEKRRRRGLKAWRKLDRTGLLEAVYEDVSGSEGAPHGGPAAPA